MAYFNEVLTPYDETAIVVTIGSPAASSNELSLGKNGVFAINSRQLFYIKFGLTGMGAATSSDFLIPPDTIIKFDLGNKFTHIRLFSYADATIFIQRLSRN